jgi:hypothetical protein
MSTPMPSFAICKYENHQRKAKSKISRLIAQEQEREMLRQ